MEVQKYEINQKRGEISPILSSTKKDTYNIWYKPKYPKITFYT